MKKHPAGSKMFACLLPSQALRGRVTARDAIRVLAGVLMWAFTAASVAQSANELFKRAFELLQKGEAPVAIEMFRMGLALDPDNGLARLYLGNALERREPPDESGAEAEYRRASELLQGRAEGAEAASRAQKLADKRSRANLLVNKTLLNGKWCYKGPTFSGYYGIRGNHVDIVQADGSNTGRIEILGESRFSITIRGLFGGSVEVLEMIGPDAFDGVGENRSQITGNDIVRRCG